MHVTIEIYNWCLIYCLYCYFKIICFAQVSRRLNAIKIFLVILNSVAPSAACSTLSIAALRSNAALRKVQRQRFLCNTSISYIFKKCKDTYRHSLLHNLHLYISDYSIIYRVCVANHWFRKRSIHKKNVILLRLYKFLFNIVEYTGNNFVWFFFHAYLQCLY